MNQWFERHPHLLAREQEQLTNNGNYQEHRQARAVFLASTGEVLVRTGGSVRRYPILLVYPQATPFALPIVYVLREVLGTDDLHRIVRGEELHEEILRGKIAFHQRRHQQPNGCLCLLEPDNLDQQGALTVDANGILARVRDWLAGLTTGYFPAESTEVNLFEHYLKRFYQFQVLLPAPFLHAAGQEGSFYLHRIGAAAPGGIVRYLAGTLLSQSASGLLLPETHIPLGFVPESLGLTAESLDPAIDNTGRLAKKELLEGTWWKLASEPAVFATANDFLLAVGEGSLTVGEQRVSMLVPQLLSSPPTLVLGCCFPNRRNELEWVLLLAYRVRETPLAAGSALTVAERLSSYDFGALYTEPFTDHYYHQRNAARAERDVLKSQSASLLGCGALGSELADSLAKAGVGWLHLCDNELLHARNSVRHLAGIRFAGSRKVDAVRRLLLDHNPFIRVTVSDHNLLGGTLGQQVPENGVGLSTVADDNVEAYLNERALELGRTMFYARALRGGKAARIFRVIPGRDACFHCLTLYRAEETATFPVVPDDETLPTVRNECNNPIRPASAADLKFIAALTSRLVLEYLTAPELGITNHWLFSSESLPGLSVQPSLPFAVDGRTLEPHPHCPYCRPVQPVSVTLSQSTLSFMQELTVARAGIETGGILVGRVAEDGTIVIEEASGPGPNALHAPGRFERDTAYCQQFLLAVEERGLSYVGEWHSHPDANNSPSYTDIDSLTQIARQPNYHTAQPVMLIFSSTGTPACTVHPAERAYYAVTPHLIS